MTATPTPSAPPTPPAPPAEGTTASPAPAEPADRILIMLLSLFLLAIGYRWFDDGRGSARPLTEDFQQKIDINAAGRAELQQLPGVGAAKAERIVAKRASDGKLADLRGVPGFGDKSVQRLDSYVRNDPAEPEPERLTRKPPTPTPPAGGNAKKALPEPESVPVNTASIEALQKLPGIGSILAQRIVAERERKPFATAEDLRRVSGIGPKKLEQIRPLIRFD